MNLKKVGVVAAVAFPEHVEPPSAANNGARL